MLMAEGRAVAKSYAGRLLAVAHQCLLAAAVIFGAGLATTNPATAATISSKIVDGTPIITIEGEAVLGDAKTFAAIVAARPLNPATVVDLSGPGGMVVDGMRIGNIIHRLGWTTRVVEGHACYSTCAFTWLAGKRRIMSADAHVAFHAPFDRHTHLVTDTGRGLMTYYAKAVELNPATVAFIMAKAPGQGFDWLDAAKAKSLDLTMEVVPCTKRQAGHFSTGAVDRVEGAAADERDGGPDAVMKDVAACYASYRRDRADEKGFQCFALEAASIVMARARAKSAHHAIDARFTMVAAVRRLGAALVATGHNKRTARVLVQRWQADLHATASR